MKPRSPFIQAFEKLPRSLPLYVIENALLPGGELPLELATPAELALFQYALKRDQLIGMVQPQQDNPDYRTYQTGCAGRVRQYRERKDGRINVMLTGICRYKQIETLHQEKEYLLAKVDWSGFENDYQTEDVETAIVDDFKNNLRSYFNRHSMQADWEVLNKLPIEQVVNNLVLVMHFSIPDKQKLLESSTVTQRLLLFSTLMQNKADPILPAQPKRARVN